MHACVLHDYRDAGKRAQLALLQRIGRNPVTCRVKQKDQYGRKVSVCYDKSGQDLNAWMAANGEAVAYREYSKDYAAASDQAKAGKKVRVALEQPPSVMLVRLLDGHRAHLRSVAPGLCNVRSWSVRYRKRLERRLNALRSYAGHLERVIRVPGRLAQGQQAEQEPEAHGDCRWLFAECC